MITDVTATASTTSASDSMKESIGLNKDDFLKLFITQLQYQDPLNPQDSSEFVSQLAQLTQVEQAYNTNTNLESLLAAQNNSMSMSAVSFIGKTVTALGNSIPYDGTSSAVINFNLPDSVSAATLSISDSSGNIVRSYALDSMAAGDGSCTWDGKDSDGNALAAGNYTYGIVATGIDGSSVTATTYTTGTISGVSFASDTPSVTVGSQSYPLTDIVNIQAA